MLLGKKFFAGLLCGLSMMILSTGGAPVAHASQMQKGSHSKLLGHLKKHRTMGHSNLTRVSKRAHLISDKIKNNPKNTARLEKILEKLTKRQEKLTVRINKIQSKLTPISKVAEQADAGNAAAVEQLSTLEAQAQPEVAALEQEHTTEQPVVEAEIKEADAALSDEGVAVPQDPIPSSAVGGDE